MLDANQFTQSMFVYPANAVGENQTLCRSEDGGESQACVPTPGTANKVVKGVVRKNAEEKTMKNITCTRRAVDVPLEVVGVLADLPIANQGIAR